MPQIHRHPEESGQTMAEYALLISLIAILVVAAFPPIVSEVNSFFSAAGAAFGG